MTLDDQDLDYLFEQAKLAATSAAEVIQQNVGRFVAQQGTVETKAGGDTLASQVVTQVDRDCDQLIRQILGESIAKYDLAILTEETEDDGLRLIKDYFWCADPLDGTLQFTRGEPGYAVAIALISREGEGLLGVVCEPQTGAVFSALKGRGCNVDGKLLHVSQNACNKTTLDFSFDINLRQRDDFSELLASLKHRTECLGYEQVNCQEPGGAVMNACHALMNGAGGYFKWPKPKQGGGCIWDFAATSVLYQEAGAKVGDASGAPLNLNPEASLFYNHCGVLFATDDNVADVMGFIMEKYQPKE